MSIDPREFADDYPNNSDRAEWAEHALAIFCDETGLDHETEKQEAVSDLLCNLGHYCDIHSLDFLAVASGAIAVWDAEKREEANDEANALYPEKQVMIALLEPVSN